MAGIESVQHELYDHDHIKKADLYYADGTNTELQSIPCTQNTRLSSAFQSLGAGTSQFMIPVSAGSLQDIVVQFGLQAGAAGSSSNLALPAGWGAALIKSISYRIAGSTQYFQAGAQSLVQLMSRCSDQTAKDQLFALMGSQITTDAVFQLSNYAYVPLSLPWTRPTVVGKPAGIALDLLGSQVIVTVELNSLASILSVGSGATVPSTLTSLGSAYFTAQVVQLDSQSSSMAASGRPAIYRSPVEFVNQELQVSLGSNVGSQQVLLAGFRNGTLKKVVLWLTKGSDMTQTTNSPLQPFKFYAPTGVQLTYAGNVYANYSNGSSQCWNILNSRMPSYLTSAGLTFSTPGYVAATASAQVWVDCPLSQTFDDPVTGCAVVQEGLHVTNGTMQATVTTPTAATDYVLHASYIYQSSIAYENASAEMIF